MENTSQEPRNNFTVYSALYGDSAHLEVFGKSKTVYEPDELTNKNSILILHGGSDISPSIYKHPVSSYTQADAKLSQRDRSEVALAKRAIELGIPIFGICRGAQLACALAGGFLVQHVDNHVGGNHEVITDQGEIYKTTTCHHQMMYPWEVDHELIAWSAPNRSQRYIIKNDQEVSVPCEPEVVLFPKIKALGIQGHPEWMGAQHPFVEYCLSLVKERLL